MKISCKQFEELIPFFLNNELSENLKNAFVEHMHNCPHCHIKFNMLNSIVNDLKDAYNQLTFETSDETINLPNPAIEENKSKSYELITNLSAYIDNELNDDMSIQIRKNIVSQPKLRKKIEKLYGIRKLLNNSFTTEQNRLRTDFSKDIIKRLNIKTSKTWNYTPCFAFILFVITIVITSILIIQNILL